MDKYIKASEIASKIFKLKLPKPKYADVAITSSDSMAMGSFYERQIIDYVSNFLGLKVQYKINKENVRRYLFTIKNINYYLIGRADGLLYASYSDKVNLYVYEHILEVKNMISYSINDFNNDVPDYYIPQIRAYNYLYQLPVLFVAQCYDGYIIKNNPLEKDEVIKFLYDLKNILSMDSI